MVVLNDSEESTTASWPHLASKEDETSTAIKQKIQRLTASQIYCQLLSIRQEALSGPNRGREPEVTRIFRRYLERKIEADTLEEEARTRNVSLNEIEEERNKGGARRRLRTRRNKKTASSAKTSVAASEDAAGIPVSRLNSKVEAGVKYDPYLVSSMQWTMKYAPQCAEDVIGNGGVVRDLASWLGEWEAKDVKRRRRFEDEGSSSSSDSDYSDVSDELFDEEDLPNTAILVGPNGVGKTASVYALAHEMGFKVLEVNASSSRNGRQVLTNLREATQSHDVRKRENNLLQKQQQPQQKHSRRQAKENGGTNSVDRTALILFEDIDLAFGEADEGVYSAVNSLIATTKRPIILTTSKSSFLAMQDSAKSKVLKLLPQAFTFSPVKAGIAARNLQLMALVEGFSIDLNSLRTFCHLHDGNVSRAILDLQCLLTSKTSTASFPSSDSIRRPFIQQEQENRPPKEEVLENLGKHKESCSAAHPPRSDSHVDDDDEKHKKENEKIVSLMGIELPTRHRSDEASNDIPDKDNEALDAVESSGLLNRDVLTDSFAATQQLLHLPSSWVWERSTHSLLRNCCKATLVNDADPSKAVTRPQQQQPFASTSAASSYCSDGAIVTKPVENCQINLHSTNLNNDGDGVGTDRGCFFAQSKEQKTKSWQKTPTSSADFRKNKQMLNHLSRRAEVASLFWPRVCTCCQDSSERASGGHKWGRTLSCPETLPAASEADDGLSSWDPLLNDLVASYIHGESAQEKTLNTKDDVASLKMPTITAGNTIATLTSVSNEKKVTSEANTTASLVRDNDLENEDDNEDLAISLKEAHEEALASLDFVNRTTAFMDVLPVMRTMLRSEAARKDTIMEVKRSNRAGRFLHYFDSINLGPLNEATLETLKRPFYQ